jgi:hypothetical protein
MPPPQETVPSPLAVPASWNESTAPSGPLFDMVGVPGDASVQMDADGTEARHAMMRGTIKVAVVTAAWQCHSACMHFALAPVLVTCGQAAAPFQALTSGEGMATIDLGTIDAAQVTWHVNAHAQDAHACVD